MDAHTGKNVCEKTQQIAPLNPDLVMMKSYLKEQLGDQVEQLGNVLMKPCIFIVKMVQ